MSRTLLQVHIIIPWKVRAYVMSVGSKPTPQFRSTASNVGSIATKRLIAIWCMIDTIGPRTRPCFPFGPFLNCLRGVYSLSTRVPRSAKISMRQMMGAFCGFLEADVSNSYLVLPNYANGTFHFHKDWPDGRLLENVREWELVWQAFTSKNGRAIHKNL
jgi:hypothetical protein